MANKISVIITSFNAGRFIKECIQSVLNQTYEDYEIIIVDGGSTDNTFEEIKPFEDKINLIKLTQQKEYPLNQDAFHRNQGLKVANGEYIIFLDADDILLPKKLEIEASGLEKDSYLGMVYSDVYICNEYGKGYRLMSKRTRPFSGNIFAHLVVGNFIPVHSAMVKRECIEKIGPFDETLPACTDWEMWLRISAYYQIKYLNIPLAKYRIHSTNISKNWKFMAEGHIKVLNKVFNNPQLYNNIALNNSDRAIIYYTLSKQYCILKDKKQALSFVKKAITINPFYVKSYILLLLILIGIEGNVFVAFEKRVGKFTQRLG